MEKSEQNQTVLLRLDDLSLERATAGYPEELRQQVMWLGCFVREECMRDLDILVNRCQSLKIAHDKTSWSRILRGRWNQDASSNPLPNPIIALGKVLSAIKTLRDDQRVREMSGKVPFVETPTTLDIFRYIDARRAPERVNRFGVIVGYTGSQKTVTLKAYAAKHNHGLCVWMESPENGSMKEF